MTAESVIQVVATVVSVSAVVLGAGWRLAVNIATLDTKFEALSKRIDLLEGSPRPRAAAKKRYR